MNLGAIITELHAYRKRIDRVIARLEQKIQGSRRSTRGRKTMPREERRQVSARMKAYWARRRGESHTSESLR